MKKWIRYTFLQNTKMKWRIRWERLLCELGFHELPKDFEKFESATCRNCGMTIANKKKELTIT